MMITVTLWAGSLSIKSSSLAPFLHLYNNTQLNNCFLASKPPLCFSIGPLKGKVWQSLAREFTSYVSGALHLRYAAMSALSQFRQSGALGKRYAGLLFLVDAEARHRYSAEFSTKQTGSHTLWQQYNIQLLFETKHSMLTPAHTSKKIDNTSSSTNPSVRNTLCCCNYVIIVYDYRRNSSVSWRQLSTVLLRGRLKTQLVGVAAQQSKTGLEPWSGHVSDGISGLLISSILLPLMYKWFLDGLGSKTTNADAIQIFVTTSL